jgi:hypothetical protein
MIFILIIFLIIVIIYLYFKDNFKVLNNNNEVYDTVTESIPFGSQTNHDNQNVNNNNDILGIYYTEWCGYSRHFLSDYQNMKNEIEKLVNVNLVDCDKDPETCRKKNVNGFPTLILHKKDKDITYNGDRSKEDLLRFLNTNM